MKKILQKAWEKLVGAKKVESTEEIILNRARRRFLAKYLCKTRYSNIKAKDLPLSVPYGDALAICHEAGVDINYLLSVS
jgi:hypothetical protein